MSIFGPPEELRHENIVSDVELQPDTQPLPSPSEENVYLASDQDLPDFDGDKLERERFAGKAYKWRRLTRFDRQVVRAQDSIDDGDLSIHLYNAHALRARVRRPEAELATLKSWHSKDRWKVETDWVPGRLWTAWPLDESVVAELNDKDGSLLSKQVRVHEELEQSIAAKVLKEAHTKFNTEMKGDVADPQSSENEASGVESDKMMKKESDGETNSNNRSDALQAPLPMADDEKAWQLIHPAVRRTIASLDSLLKLLHDARQNRYGTGADRGAETSGSDSRPPKRQRSTSRGRSASRRSSRSSNQASSTHAHSKSEMKDAEPQRARGLRDWSEILGYALQSGWDAEAIRRAATRCSDLFSESMMFRDLGQSEQRILAPDFSEIPTYPQGSDMLCPMSECGRHLNSHRALTIHLRKTHGLNIAWCDPESDMAFIFKGNKQPNDTKVQLITRQTNVTTHLLSDGTHRDGFLQPIIAGKEWSSDGDDSVKETST